MVMASTAYITNKGLNILANRLKGVGDEPIYFAWGSGAGVAAPGDLALFTEESELRAILTSQLDTVSSVGDSYKLSGAIVANADKIITNWGVFDAPVGGNLLLHESISPGESYKIGQVGAFLFRILFVRGT
jgi:hypothetical protein